MSRPPTPAYMFRKQGVEEQRYTLDDVESWSIEGIEALLSQHEVKVSDDERETKRRMFNLLGRLGRLDVNNSLLVGDDVDSLILKEDSELEGDVRTKEREMDGTISTEGPLLTRSQWTYYVLKSPECLFDSLTRHGPDVRTVAARSGDEMKKKLLCLSRVGNACEEEVINETHRGFFSEELIEKKISVMAPIKEAIDRVVSGFYLANRARDLYPFVCVPQLVQLQSMFVLVETRVPFDLVTVRDYMADNRDEAKRVHRMMIEVYDHLARGGVHFPPFTINSSVSKKDGILWITDLSGAQQTKVQGWGEQMKEYWREGSINAYY